MNRRPVNVERLREREQEDRILRAHYRAEVDPRMVACAFCGAVVNVWRSGARYDLNGAVHDCRAE